LLGKNALHELAVYRPRPWPAAHLFGHLIQTAFIDVHNHNVGVRCLAGRIHTHQHILQPIFDRCECVEDKEIDDDQQDKTSSTIPRMESLELTFMMIPGAVIPDG